jgi:DNA-binding transcriptional MerR regulator/methylmalonyl-CoA mutase cobalamin-binding subunit
MVNHSESDRADRQNPDAVLTIQEVSRLLQVPAPTIRSWERRYGIPAAGRSEGGHRRYTPAQLTLLRRMRDEISRGHPAVQAAALVQAAATGSTNPLIATFLEAAHRLDPVGMGHVLDTARATLGLAATIDEILLPAMREIGRWWETGRCDVAHEHLATTTIQVWLRANTGARPRSQPQPLVLLSCGPRDHHTLGLESIGTLLGNRGFDCRLLGARTPATSLAVAVQESRPAAVVLVSHLSGARRAAVDALRAAHRADADFFYAGNAFGSPQSRRGVPGTYLGNNLGQAAAVVAAAIMARASKTSRHASNRPVL